MMTAAIERWTAPIWLLVSVLLTTACSPGGDVDVESSKFLIYDLDEETGEYGLTRVQINSLRNVTAADGEIAYLRGGGQLKQSTEEPTSREEWEGLLTIEESISPQIEYTVDDDGTVIPWDFDSAMMLTVYHHFERAHEYFDAIPLGDSLRGELGDEVGDLVGRIPVYYYPTLNLLGLPIPLFTDNAAYAFTLDAFIVPPRRELVDAVPIYANRGVITHEFTHAVFNRLVYEDERVPDPVFEEWSRTDSLGLPADQQAFTAYNELNGLDEGIADIFGALDTGDPNYIAASISEELIDRDLAKERFYESCLAMSVDMGVYPQPSACGGDYPEVTCSSSTGSCETEEFDGDPVDSRGVRFDYAEGSTYDSHHLGAVVASILWDLREERGGGLSDEELEQILIKTLHDIRSPERTFRLTVFFDTLHDNLPADLQSNACTLFRARLPAIQNELQCMP